MLGKTDISVSALCLGTMYFGTTIDIKTSFDILDEYILNGGNFIDTANNYCYWNGGTGNESEILLGKWMQTKKNRKHIVLASKVGARQISNNPNCKLEGLSKNTIIKSVEESLKRLNTSYLDICYIHADFKEYPLDERLEALYLLEKSGKIRFNGYSNLTLDRYYQSLDLVKRNNYSEPQCLQQKYTYLTPNKVDKNNLLKIADDEFINAMEKNKTTLIVYSILLSGMYSLDWDKIDENYKSSRNKMLYKKMKHDSALESCTSSQWVIKWILNKSKNIIPIISASSIKQIKENLIF